MGHPFFSAPRPLVFAHRGGAGLAPENTIAAFDNARSLGADGIELDVHLARDGVVVVHHDQTLDRTTRLKGPVAGYRADELEPANVPALATVLARYPELRVIIELKVNSEDLARAAVAVVRDAKADERVCLGSFWTGVVKSVRTLAPGLATSAAREEVRWALYRSWCRWPAAHVPYDGFQIRNSPVGRASCHNGSSTTRTAPASACRCGPLMMSRPHGDCLAGGSMH